MLVCITVLCDTNGSRPVNFNLSYVTGESVPKKEDTTVEPGAKDNGSVPQIAKPKVKDPRAVMASAAAARGDSAAAPTMIIPAATEEAKSSETSEQQGPNKDAKTKVQSTLPPGHARPVIIHRAMAGSIERFMGT